MHTYALMHINWLKIQICVLGCMLRSHARNGNEIQTPGHCWLPAKRWDAWFLNSSKSKTCLKFMKLGMLSWNGTRHVVVNYLSLLGQVWVYASHKPELLTTSMMVFGRERPPLGTKRYPLPLIDFNFFSRVNIEQQECCVIFLWFFRVRLDIFYALSAFSTHLCA